jgi:hypothetical protein
MSGTKTKEQAMMAATRAWQRARQSATDAMPTVAAVKPLASNTKDAASRRLHKARAWAAPQLERTGKVLEDTVAPKVSAALSSSARKLRPATPPRRRWGAVAGIAILMAAAGAVAVVLRKRQSSGTASAASEAAAGPDAAAGTNAGPKDPARASHS